MARGNRSKDEKLVRTAFWSKLQAAIALIPFAEDLLAAYYCAFDRRTPAHVKIALIGALAYFVMPFDGVPDFLPMVGFADDAAMLAAALRLVAGHVQSYHREAAREKLETFGLRA